MKLLLDTHALLWWLFDVPRLRAKAREEIGRPTVEVYVSAVSVCEISIKQAKGRLEAPEDLATQIAASGFRELPFDVRHGLEIARLPPFHADPFDRMLIAQARVEGLTLVTADRALMPYGVPILPAEV